MRIWCGGGEFERRGGEMKDARRLDVVLHSATELKKVSASRMAVLAVAWIVPSVRVPSPGNVKARGTNPVWNTTISLSLEERTMAHGMCLNVELLGHGLVSTRRIGFVSVDMTEIFQEGSKGAAVHSHFQAHPVSLPFQHGNFPQIRRRLPCHKRDGTSNHCRISIPEL